MPHLGGLFSFYLEMRPALAAIDIDLRCVSPQPVAAGNMKLIEKYEGCEFLEGDQNRLLDFSLKLREYIEQEKYSGIIIVPGSFPAATLLPCLLPPEVISIGMIPHNGRSVYTATKTISSHLDWIVAVNKLLWEDLVHDYGISENQVKTVFVGVDASTLGSGRKSEVSGSLHIVFTSRIDDMQKNVFMLPDILKDAERRGGHYRLDILCRGPDLLELQKRFAKTRLNADVRFIPSIKRMDMLRQIGDADVIIMMSRFEGCPHSLIEAMACCCVPVVSRLPGIFDTMMENGKEGWLCEIDRVDDFGQRLYELAWDVDMRRRMGHAARLRALRDFDVHKQAEIYSKLLDTARMGKRASLAPSEADVLYHQLCRKTWRRAIPAPLKKMIRTFMAKRGKTI